MFNPQAVGAIVIALALPAFADSPPELTHRLEQYQEMVHRLNQYPEVIAAGHTHAVDPWKNKIHTVEQHSGSDVVELQSLSNSAISFV